MDMNKSWDELLGQHNIQDVSLYNSVSIQAIPITGVKNVGSYVGRNLYLANITKSNDGKTIKTMYPMDHFQIVKLFLEVEFPAKDEYSKGLTEMVMFNFPGAEKIVFRSGELSRVGDPSSYTYNIGCFQVIDGETIMSIKGDGNYFESHSTNFIDPLPVKPVAVYALTTNRNLGAKE